MELLKPLEDFFHPDQRNRLFVTLDPLTGGYRPSKVEDQSASVNAFPLHSGVPEEVVSFMNTVKMLFVYGWLYYPFYSVAHCFSAMCVEMALRKRFPNSTGGRDKRGLNELLNTAVKHGLIRDAGFPSLIYRQADDERFAAYLKEITGEQPIGRTKPYIEILAEALPKVRNSLAHPHGHWIVTPGMAIEQICLAVELINQLWPEPSPAAAE